jgi:hypothetical protein
MQQSDIARVEAYLRRTLGSDRIRIEAPKRFSGGPGRR